MTSPVTQGLGMKAAAAAVAEKAAEELARSPGAKAGIWTEVGSSVVLVGYATPGACGAIAIDRSEYDGLAVMEILERVWKSS